MLPAHTLLNRIRLTAFSSALKWSRWRSLGLMLMFACSVALALADISRALLKYGRLCVRGSTISFMRIICTQAGLPDSLLSCHSLCLLWATTYKEIATSGENIDSLIECCTDYSPVYCRTRRRSTLRRVPVLQNIFASRQRPLFPMGLILISSIPERSPSAKWV